MEDAVTFISALAIFEEDWWGYGTGCSHVSWAVKGGLMQEFSSIVYCTHIIDYFKFKEDSLGKKMMTNASQNVY